MGRTMEEEINPVATVKRWYGMAPRANISVSLPTDLIKMVESFARAWGITRSAAVAYLLTQGLARHRELSRLAAEKMEGEK